MSAGNPLVVKGHSGHLAVPILAVPAVAVGASLYYRDALPTFCAQNAGRVLALAGLLTAALAALALFRRTRSVELRGDRLRYRSWVTDRTVRAGGVSAVTFEAEVAAGPDEAAAGHYLTLWAGEDPVLRFNAGLWPRAGMRALLLGLRERAPGVRLDRDVERYMAGES